MNSQRTIIAIGGPKGVGKTALIKKLRPTLKNFAIICTGKILQEIAQRKYHKDFVFLDKTKKHIIRKRYAERVLAIDKNQLLDIHFGEFEDGGYPCVVPENLLEAITHFILITASPEEIQKRRKLDGKSRKLDLVSIQLNTLGEKLLFKELTANRNVKKLYEVNKTIDQTVDKIINFIRE